MGSCPQQQREGTDSADEDKLTVININQQTQLRGNKKRQCRKGIIALTRHSQEVFANCTWLKVITSNFESLYRCTICSKEASSRTNNDNKLWKTPSNDLENFTLRTSGLWTPFLTLHAYKEGQVHPAKSRLRSSIGFSKILTFQTLGCCYRFILSISIINYQLDSYSNNPRSPNLNWTGTLEQADA